MNEKPTVYLYKPSGNKYDITKACDGIQWSGDYQQAARKLELDILSPVNDKNQSIIIPNVGDFVALYTGSTELFRGVVWTRDMTYTSEFTKITAFDALIYLTKSTTSYNLKGITPADTVRKVSNDFKVPVGNIASPNVKYSDCAMGKAPYEMIMAGYTKAKETTGKIYMPRMNKGKLDVIIKGDHVVSEVMNDKYNVQNAQYNESLDGMVNKVIIYDDKGNITNHVENQGWIDLYGIIQNAIQADKEKDNMAIARKALKDMDRKVSLDAFGHIEAITGNAVKVKAPHSAVNGVFYIDGDTHSWKGGLYTMNLTLNFQNLMDEKETQKESESGEDSSSNKDSGTKGTWEAYEPGDTPGHGTDNK